MLLAPVKTPAFLVHSNKIHSFWDTQKINSGKFHSYKFANLFKLVQTKFCNLLFHDLWPCPLYFSAHGCYWRAQHWVMVLAYYWRTACALPWS